MYSVQPAQLYTMALILQFRKYFSKSSKYFLRGAQLYFSESPGQEGEKLFLVKFQTDMEKWKQIPTNLKEDDAVETMS